MSAAHEPTVTGRYATVLARAAEMRAGQDQARQRRTRFVVGLTDALTLVAGLWLICAPYALNYTGTGRLDGYWSDVLAGGVIGLAALVRLAEVDGAVAVRVGSVLLGGCLAAAPFLLGYGAGSAPRATANEVAVGAVVILLSLVGLRALAAGRAESTEPPATVNLDDVFSRPSGES